MAQGEHLQKNCGPGQELAISRKMTHHAGVAQRKRNFIRKYSTMDNTEQETRKGTSKKRLWKGPECNNGIRDRGLRLHL
jgi:hypothetical protein